MIAFALPMPRVGAERELVRTYDFGELTGRIEDTGGFQVGPDLRPIAKRPAKFAWTLDCPDCETGLDVDDRTCTTCRGSGELASGTCPRGDTAFLRLWCRAAVAPAPVDMSRDELEALAAEAEAAVVIDAAKVYRRVLRQRTGFDWSVRVGKGPGRDTIWIMSAPRRQVDGKMTAHDTALLASIASLGFVNPHGGVAVAEAWRRSMTYTLAGVPEPCAPVLELVKTNRG